MIINILGLKLTIWGKKIPKREYRFNEEKHIHSLNEKPLKGTTTVIKEVLPPPLSWYGSGRACKAMGWYDRKYGRANYLPDKEGMPVLEEALKGIKQMTSEEYLKLLDKAYKAHNEYKKSKGDWGKKVHESIEIAIKSAIKDNKGYLLDAEYENEVVEKFASWGRGKKFLYSEVHVYSEKLWLGGIIDFIYVYGGKTYLGDIKTAKSIYASNFIQAGLYDYQQAENGFFTPDGKKLGESLSLNGYTVVNLPKEGGIRTKTYYGTKIMGKFSVNLVELYKTKERLEKFC